MWHVCWNDYGFHIMETPSKTGLTFRCPLVGHFDDEDTLCLVACLTPETLSNVECGGRYRPYGLTAGFEVMVQAVTPASRFQSLSGDSYRFLGRITPHKLHRNSLSLQQLQIRNLLAILQGFLGRLTLRKLHRDSLSLQQLQILNLLTILQVNIWKRCREHSSNEHQGKDRSELTAGHLQLDATPGKERGSV